ncbi:MAG: MFS transporter [Candidatus Rokuibacteriota bacterium]
MLERSLRQDARVIGLVSGAHCFSHFFQLTLPPLFPLLKTVFDVPWVALGLAMSVFYGASGLGQTISGFLVDRIGARRVLLSGMSLFALAIALAGVVPSYGWLLLVALLAGLGNSVFHPADYSIFNAVVSPRRLARAYAIHSVSGGLGWAIAPAVVGVLTTAFGWRCALLVVGGAGLVAVTVLATQGDALLDRHAAGAVRAGARSHLAGDVRLLMTAPILMAFAYFAFAATASVGLQTFSITAMVSVYAVPLALATRALTAFLIGGAAGVLAGGFLADRVRRHDLVAAGGLTLAAALMLLVGTSAVPVGALAIVMSLAGFFQGATAPSRDMLVRAATPPGASGKVFGFVYSGLDLGSSLTPLAFGLLLDRGEPRVIFLAVAALMLATIVTVVQVRRSAVLAAARA